MAQRMSLEHLSRFLKTVREAMATVAAELDAVQVQFVSAHQAAKADHDAALDRLSRQAADALETLPAEVRAAIETRLAVERQTLESRRRELAERLVPQAEQAVDDLLALAQTQREKVRALNPRLNEQEEHLKAKLAAMEQELDQLNREIKRLSGCLTMFVNFFKINTLDRRRQRLLGRMDETARALRQVRQEWVTAKADYVSEDADLQPQWEQAALEAARAREELVQLSDDDKRARLALERAIFYVFDHWQTPVPDGAGPWSESLNQMAQLNLRTDTYQEGLGKVAGLIALLNGVGQGMENIRQSVDALQNECKMHSAYLPPLFVQVDDTVVAFHSQWDRLRAQVKDEKALAKTPAEFCALFDAQVSGDLSEAAIKQMFASLNASLKAATHGWKG